MNLFSYNVRHLLSPKRCGETYLKRKSTSAAEYCLDSVKYIIYRLSNVELA